MNQTFIASGSLKSSCAKPMRNRCRDRRIHSQCSEADELVAFLVDNRSELKLYIVMAGVSNAKERRSGSMHEFALKAKRLEINPRSPLIEGLLRRVEQLPSEEEEKDPEVEEELKEVASILIDGALVRSGFEVPDSNR